MGVDWDRGAAASLLALDPAPAPGKDSLPPFVLPSPAAPREQKGSRPGQMAHLTGQASHTAPQNTSSPAPASPLLAQHPPSWPDPRHRLVPMLTLGPFSPTAPHLHASQGKEHLHRRLRD